MAWMRRVRIIPVGCLLYEPQLIRNLRPEFVLLDRARPAAPKLREKAARLPGSEESRLQPLPSQD